MNASVASQTVRARSWPMQETASLQWSEYLFVAAVVIAEFLVVDPLGWHVNRVTALKHLPLAVAVCAVLLTVAGRKLQVQQSRPGALHRALQGTWPLAVLAVFVSLGSLYARLVLEDQATFLNIGVYMSMVVLAAVMFIESSNPHALLRWYMGTLVAGAIIMGAYIVRYYGITQVYHEQIFLVIPIAIWFASAQKNRLLAWFGALVMLLLGFFSAKNTSYLVALLIGAYIVLHQGIPRLRRMSPAARSFSYYLMLVLAATVIAVVAYIFLHREELLPSGNVEYRSHTYELAWQRFLDSPLWGTGFAAVSVKKFSLYSINIAGGMLPTHSDVMDLLANGGLLAVTLWATGILMIAYRTRRWLVARVHGEHPWAAYAHTLLGLSAAAIVTYSFNPVLLDPGMAFLLWSSLGLLAGMSVRAGEVAESTERAKGTVNV